jgi:hypothetical protein
VKSEDVTEEEIFPQRGVISHNTTLNFCPRMFTDVSEVLTASVTSVTSNHLSVNFYQSTRRNNPKDSHLHTHRRGKLTCSGFVFVLAVYSSEDVKDQYC